MTDESSRGRVDEDAIELLLADQDEIVELLDRYDARVADGSAPEEREGLADDICALLLAHAAVKEEILYPALREVIDEEYLIDEALVALDSARACIDDIQGGDPTEPRYDAQVRILHELVVQHFDEERTQLFTKARATSLDLEDLGAEIAAREELLLSVEDDAQADAP